MCHQVGVGGGGGEYVPQMGFGWTNGVALYLLKSTTSNIATESGDDDEISAGIIAVVVVSIVLFIGLIAFAAYFIYKRFFENLKSVEGKEIEGNTSILRRNEVRSNLI